MSKFGLNQETRPWLWGRMAERCEEHARSKMDLCTSGTASHFLTCMRMSTSLPLFLSCERMPTLEICMLSQPAREYGRHGPNEYLICCASAVGGCFCALHAVPQ